LQIFNTLKKDDANSVQGKLKILLDHYL